MNNHKGNRKDLNDAIAALRADVPAEEAVQAAKQRVWTELQGAAPAAQVSTIHGCDDIEALMSAFRAGELSSARRLLVQDHLQECVACRHLYQQGSKAAAVEWTQAATQVSSWDLRRMAFAAVVLVVVGVSSYLAWQRLYGPLPGVRASVESATGPVYLVGANGDQLLSAGKQLQEGEIVRTPAGSHAILRLFDGSRIEMDERVEFSVSARRSATTIKLNRGNIIVQAAKQHGHLYVVAPDCKVAVTGTVFAVNSGMKGSRVSVIEGEVIVDHQGDEDVLHSGDQVVTSPSLSGVSVEEEISWSLNREQHLALLAEFSKLQKKFSEQIATPSLRFNSGVLPITPVGTVIYASIPNYGEAMNEANRLFQDQLRNSPVLQDWWQKSGLEKEQGHFEEMIAKIHTFSKYVGEEVVFMVKPGFAPRRMDAFVVAKLVRPGLRDYLDAELARLDVNPEHKSRLRIVSKEDVLNGYTGAKGDITILASDDLVVISTDASALRDFVAESAGNTGFAASSFGQDIAASYQEGAGLLFAADLQGILQQEPFAEHRNEGHHSAALMASGIGDADHLIVKRRELQGGVDNRAVLSFTQQRRGLASWLASPSSLGAMEYVSADAEIVVAAVAKNPVQMVDDLMTMMRVTGGSPEEKMSEFRSKMNFDLREDLAASLGGDFAFALDGPVLPEPSWKFIVEVNDQARLQNTIQLLINEVNREASQHGQGGLTITSEESDGRIFYSIKGQQGRQLFTVNYTFANGYMIAGPSRGLLLQAIQVRESGASLARSSKFATLLPKDQHTNVSALLYQDLGRIVGPLAENMNPQEAQSLQIIGANAKPSLICAYGDGDSIEVATNSRFFGFDVNYLALSQLLGRSMGTLVRKNP